MFDSGTNDTSEHVNTEEKSELDLYTQLEHLMRLAKAKDAHKLIKAERG